MGQPAHGHLSERPPGGPLFWAALAGGWALIAYGILGALTNSRDTNPPDLARWFLGAAVAHDAVLAPVACLAGVALCRFVPGRIRAPLQGGLIVAGLVTLFAIPLVRRAGVRPDNPTVIFRDYGSSLAVVLAVVGLVTAALVVWAARSRR